MRLAPRLARATLAVAALGLLLVPARAHAAAGLNLRWMACFGDGGVPNNSFACNTNTGLRTMFGSFVLPADMPQAIGTEIVLQLAADSPTLPAWWQFKNLASCRQNALTAVFVDDGTSVNCVDWSGLLAIGGIGGYCTVDFPCPAAPPGANVAVIKLVSAVQSSDAQDLIAGQEYHDFRLRVSNQKTVGTGACGGCNVPVCIVLNSVNVVDLGDQHPRLISTPTVPGSNYVTYQGGGSPGVGGAIGCPAATPTRRSTWGSVKTLYR